MRVEKATSSLHCKPVWQGDNAGVHKHNVETLEQEVPKQGQL